MTPKINPGGRPQHLTSFPLPRVLLEKVMTEQDSSAPAVANPWLVAIAVMLATFMEVLDTSIAAVALPYIAGSVSATNDEATWVLTSYLVANAIVLPASSWFSRALRTQAIPDRLHHDLHRFLFCLRSRDQPRLSC